MRDLTCGREVIRVDPSLCAMSVDRVHSDAFASASGAAPVLTVRRHSSLEGSRLEAPLGSCVFRVDGATLDVQVREGPYLGELVLRLAWYLVGTRQGAVLIHANALANGSTAFVAAGKSGDGKSTLARLGSDAGLQLLTDEVVMLFPDGSVSGTPFRSDLERPGRAGVFPARYFFALEKAASEELKPLSSMAAAQLALSQCFEVKEVALPRAEVRNRLLTFLSRVELRTFAFRRHADAGAFAAHVLS